MSRSITSGFREVKLLAESQIAKEENVYVLALGKKESD